MSEANKPHEEAVSPKDADGVAKGDTPLRITDGTAELDDAVPVEAKPLLRRRVDRTAKRSLADTPAFVCYVIQRFIEDRGAADGFIPDIHVFVGACTNDCRVPGDPFCLSGA